MSVLLWVLVFAGYPTVGFLVSYLGLSSTDLTIPYRIVVATLALMVFAGFHLRRETGHISVFLVVFFSIYVCRLYYDWLFGSIPGADRALLFFVMVVVFPAVAIMRSTANQLDDRILARALIVGVLPVLVMALFAYSRGAGFNPWEMYGVETTRLGFEALNPISLGHVSSTAIICCAFLIMDGRSNAFYRIAAWLGLALGVIVIMLANSRGPVVSTVVALGWFLVLRKKRLVYLVPLLFIVPYLSSVDNVILANVIDRFTLESSEDISGGGRLYAQRLAIDAFLDSPIFGSYYINPTLGPGGYPHNLFIETAMSLGTVGLTALFAILVAAWRKAVSFYARVHPLLTMLLVQYFLGIQFSGALWGADAFIVLLAMCVTARPSPSITIDALARRALA